LFDEDRNGVAIIEDINRVLTTYTEMSDQDKSRFVKICTLSHKLTDD